jgi:hypothetical protein
MRTPFKDQKYGAANTAFHPIRKTSRSQQIVAPEGYLRWRSDSTQLRLEIMRDHGIRLLKECRQRLRGPAPDKVG